MTTPDHSVPAPKLPHGARSEEIVAKHKKYLWPSVTNYFQQPLVADRGEMQYLWDLDGNKYLDFFGGILTVSVGHCNPKISGKVAAQVNKLQHTSGPAMNAAMLPPVPVWMRFSTSPAQATSQSGQILLRGEAVIPCGFEKSIAWASVIVALLLSFFGKGTPRAFCLPDGLVGLYGLAMDM